MYKPNTPYNVGVEVFTPTYITAKGSTKKVYPVTGFLVFCNVRSFGGTEVVSNDSLVVKNTLVIETWYRPDITPESRIRINDFDYEVIGTPENIEMRNQFLKFKVEGVRDGG